MSEENLTELVERWTELGPVVWFVAASLAVLWLVLLAVVARVLAPNKVTPAPAALDRPGDEPPAVVNLVTSGWSLGRAAVPATLLDLAGRRWLEIERLGDHTTVRVRGRSPRDAHLAEHERQVLDHVGRLAALTPDGRVAAEALTSGPAEQSRDWWRRFRSSVIDQSRERGLSRPRWSAAAMGAMAAAGVVVVIAFAVAGSTVDDDESTSDDERGEAVFAGPFAATIALGAVSAVVMRGERDTPEGRAAATGWLGLRDLLGEDPVFAEQPAAAVAIWDRHLAYGAALGVAHGAVRDLPMGAESARVAWSPVGGRWRVVRVAYRRPWPPGNGRAPKEVANLGVILAGLGAAALWLVPVADRVLTEVFGSSSFDPSGLVPHGVGLLVVGGLVIAAALADRLLPPTVVEGRVLRMRRRTHWTKGGENEPPVPYWHIAVDDGTRDRLRAYRTDRSFGTYQGEKVHLTASRLFRYVRAIDAVRDRATLPPPPPPPRPAPDPTVPTVPAVAATSDPETVRPAPTTDDADGPPPPLPDASALSSALGRHVVLDVTARGHPLAADGASATYRGDNDVRVQITWARADAVGAALPAMLRSDVPALGEGAVRSRVGRGLAVPRGSYELLVALHLPGASRDERDQAAEAVAQMTLDTRREGDTRPMRQ